jgi:integrase
MKTQILNRIPVAAPVRAALDAIPKEAITILIAANKTSWASDRFRTSWGKAAEKAGISGPTFHDLRGKAVARFAMSGCTQAEIATFTGHSLNDVASILDAHYLSRDPRLAESALNKWELHEAGTKTPN